MTCEPELFDTSQDKLIESVIAWPISRDVKEITQFYIEHLNAVHFPGNLNAHFPDLESVILWDSRVRFIDNFDLRWLPKLKFLRLDDNLIEVLQTDLFLHNSQLLEIHVQNNKLKFIGARILAPLTDLRFANFKSNHCIDDKSSSTMDLETLKRNIDDNCASNEFLLKKNSDFIKKLVALNYTIADLTAAKAKLETAVKDKSQSLATCEGENEEANDRKFKAEMRLRKELSALKKAQSELAATRISNDDLTVENVKLNNELKRANARTSDAIYPNATDYQEVPADIHRLRFDNGRLLKENLLLKSFKDEVEKEWRAVTLKCDFTIWDGYACQTSSLKVRADDSEIVTVDGKHEGRKSNFEVKSFIVSSQDVRTTFLPTNIGATFPKLVNLIAQDSKIVFLKRGNFDNLLSLETLKLDHNQIAELSPGVFSDLEKLVKLDLSFNRLTMLERETLRNLKKLKFLALNDNLIEKLSASLFKSSQQLELVLLQNNKIKYIGGAMGKSLPKLKMANLRKNDCIDVLFTEASASQIDASILSKCSPPTDVECRFGALSNIYACNVVELQIENENTRIQDVSGKHQKGKSRDDVTELSIVDQSVAFFPVGFGSFLRNLRKIVVRKSMLTSVDDNSFEMLQHVAQLILADNEIRAISEDAFQAVKSSLEIIDLSSNNIAQLELKTFNNLIRLKVLDLSGNKLHQLNSNLLVHNANLLELKVGRNVLKSIGAYLLNSLRSLQLADFTGNHCINHKLPPASLQTLKLKILEQCK